MEQMLVYIIQAVVVIAVTGLVKWVYSINQDLQKHKLDSANSFVRKEELRPILNDAVEPLKEKLDMVMTLLQNNLMRNRKDDNS